MKNSDATNPNANFEGTDDIEASLVESVKPDAADAISGGSQGTPPPPPQPRLTSMTD